MTKRNAEICREAAEMIASGEELFSCSAILWADSVDYSSALRFKFSYLFCAHKLDLQASLWLNRAMDRGEITASEMKNWRITALLFFAAMEDNP